MTAQSMGTGWPTSKKCCLKAGDWCCEHTVLCLPFKIVFKRTHRSSTKAWSPRGIQEGTVRWQQFNKSVTGTCPKSPSDRGNPSHRKEKNYLRICVLFNNDRAFNNTILVGATTGVDASSDYQARGNFLKSWRWTRRRRCAVMPWRYFFLYGNCMTVSLTDLLVTNLTETPRIYTNRITGMTFWFKKPKQNKTKKSATRLADNRIFFKFFFLTEHIWYSFSSHW